MVRWQPGVKKAAQTASSPTTLCVQIKAPE
jgi:hypothetical protein